MRRSEIFTPPTVFRRILATCHIERRSPEGSSSSDSGATQARLQGPRESRERARPRTASDVCVKFSERRMQFSVLYIALRESMLARQRKIHIDARFELDAIGTHWSFETCERLIDACARP